MAAVTAEQLEMLKSVKVYDLYFYFVCSIAFFIPLIPKLLPFLTVFSVIIFFISGNINDILKKIVKLRIPLLFIGLYIFYLIGLLYSENLKYGWNDVGAKVSLLLFPIILADDRIHSENKTRILFKYYIAGCLAVCGFLVIRACCLYFSGNENVFFYEAFSYHLHPSYLSLYLNYANTVLIFEILKGEKNILFKNMILFLLFTLIIFLLSSKTGIICSVLLCIIFLLVVVIRKRNLKSYALLLFMGIGLFFTLKNFSRINFAAQVLNENKFDPESTESTAARVNIWNVSVDIIRENLLFGVGTGDVKDELFKSYQHANMTGPLQNKLNAHNQFLQTFIALGLTGFLLLVLSIIIPCLLALRNKNWTYFGFLILIIINLLTESMLERQMGILFFAFFNSLLYYSMVNKLENELHTGN